MEPFSLPQRLNIADRFLEARVREGKGDRPALLLEDGELTYRQVQTLAHRYAHALLQLGARPEERVMIALPDGAPFVGALFGTLAMGGVVVMVNPNLKEEEIAGLLAYTRVRWLLTASGTREVFAAAIRSLGEQGPRLLTLGDPKAPEALEPTLEAVGNEPLTLFDSHRDDAALWLFSGGTTGRPKGVVQTHGSFANTTELYALRTLGYSENDITLSVPKLFFGYATGSNLFFPFAAGGAAILFPEHPTAEILFEKIARYRPTILINVPTMVGKMVSHETAAQQDLSSLRFATSAGEALPVPLYERWKDTFGCELLDGLGTAEMWHIFVTNRPEDVRPGTLGRVVEGFDLRVRDSEGRDLPSGEVGRLWVRGSSRAIGYWHDQEKTQEAFRGPWFVGGDLVQQDAEGYVTYCGRGDDVLKVGGKWLVPRELESCLLRHPGVAECAVVGAEDEEGLTKPFAFVLPRGPAEGLEEALKQHALEHLQAYKHPRRVIVLDTFPRTHLGKIDRGKLKASLG